MALPGKPMLIQQELVDLIEKSRSIKMTPKMYRAQRLSFVIGQMMMAHPEMSRDYVLGILDTIVAKQGGEKP